MLHAHLNCCIWKFLRSVLMTWFKTPYIMDRPRLTEFTPQFIKKGLWNKNNTHLQLLQYVRQRLQSLQPKSYKGVRVEPFNVLPQNSENLIFFSHWSRLRVCDNYYSLWPVPCTCCKGKQIWNYDITQWMTVLLCRLITQVYFMAIFRNKPRAELCLIKYPVNNSVGINLAVGFTDAVFSAVWFIYNNCGVSRMLEKTAD